MSTRPPQLHVAEVPPQGDTLPEPVVRTTLVLAVGDEARRDRLSVRLGAGFGEVRLARVGESRFVPREREAVVVVSDRMDDALALAERSTREGEPVSVVLLAGEATAELATRAMRAGVADLITGEENASELANRMRRAAERAMHAENRRRREERLRQLAQRLNDARHDVSRQVRGLCQDLVEAYQEVTDNMTRLTIAAEFSSMIRNELDVETLLRTALEFILAKVGPTNAAVFLPSTSDEYSLGAYVNYDGPKDTTEMLLDHLAAVIPERIEGEDEIVRLTGERELVRRFGEGAEWLGEANLLAFACRDEDECLAVVVLFRDIDSEFDERAEAVCRALANLFGQQLGRVIRIHHRHLPPENWGLPGESPDEGHDDLGLAA